MTSFHTWQPSCGDGIGPMAGPPWYALVCRFVEHIGSSEVCARPASVHLRGLAGCGTWHDTSACIVHARYARQAGFDEEHTVAGSACSMPGARWRPGGRFFGWPTRSRCVIDHQTPQRPAHAYQERTCR